MRKTFILIVLLAAPALLFSSQRIGAQETSPGSGLGISPVLSEFNLKPGQADKLDINLRNITGGDIIAEATINDFVSDNESGNPRIITDPNKKSPNSIRDFVIGLEGASLAKGEQKKITVTLQAPDKIPPGAYYGIIRFKAVPVSGTSSSQPGAVALTASVGTIVLITVPGNLRDQIQLTNLFVYSNKKAGSFFTSKPNQAGIEVKNLGNGFAQPFGAIELTGNFNKKIFSYQLNNSTPRSSVLPGSTRIFKNDLKNINQPGRYTLTANIAYGSGSVLVAKKTFWYIPVWLAVVILLVLLFLIVATYRLYTGRTGGKRRFKKRR
ncbi:hypothetical protein H0X09_01290 [Candidatus Saccharibacteria bacterium]|nr:hypothetical protein [Candidatus Saccharibacteria bacterium]